MGMNVAGASARNQASQVGIDPSALVFPKEMKLAELPTGVVYQDARNLQSKDFWLQSLRTQAKFARVKLPVGNLDIALLGTGHTIKHGNGSRTELFELPELMVREGILRRGGTLTIFRAEPFKHEHKWMTEAAIRESFQLESENFQVNVFLNGDWVGNPARNTPIK